MTEVELKLEEQFIPEPSDDSEARQVTSPPGSDTISIEALEAIGAFSVSSTILDETQVKLIRAQIQTNLLRYKRNELVSHTTPPSKFKFWSYLGVGVASIGAGSLTLAVGDKPGTFRTIIGSVGIGVGTVSLAGAVINFPVVRATVKYSIECTTADQNVVVLTIILPLGLSDLEFVQQSCNQVMRGLSTINVGKKDNPSKDGFDAESKDDTIGKMNPEDVLSEADPLEQYGANDIAPAPIDAPAPAPAPAPKGDSNAGSSVSVKSEPSSSSGVSAKSDIDLKYGSVIKPPSKPGGINEHTAVFL